MLTFKNDKSGLEYAIAACRLVADQSQSEADAVKSRPNGEFH
jgi:hypothetical protein